MQKFKVEVRKTVIYTQTITIESGNEENAQERAINHVDENAWEYDTDFVDAVSVEEQED